MALSALIALLVIAALAAFRAAPPERGSRELGEMIGRRIACAPRHPVPCGRHPLALAYGFPVGKLVRHLAPPMPAVTRAGGALLPVDFRRCRRASCASPGEREGLTASNRRVTAFTSVQDSRRAGGTVRITYWLYRPTLGWEAVVREGGAAEIAAASSLRLDRGEHPVLVPLETLAGRNHHRFAPGEEPPWRWAVPERSPP